MSVRRVDDRSLYRGHTPPTATTRPVGTAHGPAIELKPRAGATTGGYLVIDQPQANAIMGELENEQAINPLTLERPELRASIFRTVARTPKENGDPRYSYWDPAELWRWLKQPERQGRMPDTNEPAWFEDWWALYYTYGAPFVPNWAYSLEKRDRNTQPSASVAQQMLGAGQEPPAAPGSDAPETWRYATQMMRAENQRAARAPRRRAGLFAEDQSMETQEEANARADREEAEQARRQREWDEWRRSWGNDVPQPTQDQARLAMAAAAERERQRQNPNPFGSL